MLFRALQNLGLSEKESTIYLTLLKLGQASAFTISKKANIHHSTVYVNLESLIKKGLITKQEKKSTTIFKSIQPLALHRLIKDEKNSLAKKEEKLNELLPEITSLFLNQQTDSFIRIYEGIEGYLKLERDSIKIDGKLGPTTIYAITPLDLMYESGKVTMPPSHKIITERANRGQHLKQIYINTAKLKNSNPKLLRESRFLPRKRFPINSMLVIIPNHSVRVYSFKKREFRGIWIINAEMANSAKVIFDLIWEIAEKE